MIAPIGTTQTSLLAPGVGEPADAGENAFRDLLAKARSAAGASGRASGGTDEVRASAEQLVSTAFIAPILKQIRESSDAAPPFQQTPAEKQFGSMLDAKTAESIVRASNLPIVDRLTATFRELAARTPVPPSRPTPGATA
ncbi:MAG: hypothetical protein AAGF47_01495 [Planctomycetota bacterium]